MELLLNESVVSGYSVTEIRAGCLFTPISLQLRLARPVEVDYGLIYSQYQ